MSDKLQDDTTDLHDLNRFVEAQTRDYENALSELREGHKRTHWIWYIFPQFDGLGLSATSRRYAIKSAAEAQAYLRHPLLGPRLVECCEALLNIQSRSALEILGSPDDLKLRSCMTLFGAVSPAESVSERVLARYYRGERDETTIGLLSKSK